jgi:26S proteasome regulatory subunit N1
MRFDRPFQGTLSLSPLRYGSRVLDYTALAGLMVVLVACLDCRNLILSQSHYLMYCLAVAMEPRWLITVDENLKVCKLIDRSIQKDFKK